MITPSSYTSSDRDAIEAAYGTAEEVAEALENHDESVADAGDLLSYYIEMTGTLPDFLTGAMLDPDDPALTELWADADFAEAVQDWRFQNLGQDDITATLDLLEQVEETLGGYDVNAVNDAIQLWEEYETAEEEDGEEDGAGSGEDGVLLTDMMSIALKWGNPGLALLFYVMGSETTTEVPASKDDLTASQANGENTSMTDNGDGTVTIKTETGSVTAAYGETVTFGTKGFGSIVMNGEEAVVEQFETAQQELDDISDDIGNLDPTDSDDSVELEQKRLEVDLLKNKFDVYTSIMQTMQDSLDTMTEAASGLIDSKRRVDSGVINRF